MKLYAPKTTKLTLAADTEDQITIKRAHLNARTSMKLSLKLSNVVIPSMASFCDNGVLNEYSTTSAAMLLIQNATEELTDHLCNVCWGSLIGEDGKPLGADEDAIDAYFDANPALDNHMFDIVYAVLSEDVLGKLLQNDLIKRYSSKLMPLLKQKMKNLQTSNNSLLSDSVTDDSTEQ